MRTLNYRRGLGRVYLLVAVSWFIVVTAVSIHDRPQGYGPARKTTTTAPLSTLSNSALLDAILADADLPWDPAFIRHYWEIRAAVAIVPPITGYLLFFYFVPWAWRGFVVT